MAKPNAYLLKLQAQKAFELKQHRLFTIQWCADAAILAAHEVFQRRGDKMVEFYNTFVKYTHEIAEMTMADAKDDKELAYTKGKLDRQLQYILGDAFRPWEERYAKPVLFSQQKEDKK